MDISIYVVESNRFLLLQFSKVLLNYFNKKKISITNFQVHSKDQPIKKRGFFFSSFTANIQSLNIKN